MDKIEITVDHKKKEYQKPELMIYSGLKESTCGAISGVVIDMVEP